MDKNQYMREYAARPEVKEKIKEYLSRPDIKAKKAERAREYRKLHADKVRAQDRARKEREKIADPEKVKARNVEKSQRYRERHADRVSEYFARPEVKERTKAYNARPEVKERRAEWAKENIDRRRDQWKEWRRKKVLEDPSYAERAEATRYEKTYGITWEGRDKLLADQGGVCAICKTDAPESRGWQTDHCHGSGRIRGILCHACNTGLGLFKDNIETLQAAIKYLTPP